MNIRKEYFMLIALLTTLLALILLVIFIEYKNERKYQKERKVI